MNVPAVCLTTNLSCSVAFEIVFISRGVFEGLGFGGLGFGGGWYYLKKIPVWKIFGIFGWGGLYKE